MGVQKPRNGRIKFICQIKTGSPAKSLDIWEALLAVKIDRAQYLLVA